MDPRCTIEEVTPALAQEWLDLNHRNRQLSEPSVARLAELIRRGEWMEDCTDAIGLDTNGGVVNGQHRLRAIIAAEKPVRALVLRDVRPEVIKVIDQGRGRTLAQYLAMDGRYEQPTILAGALEWVYRIRNGHERQMSQEARPTVPQLLDLLSEHPNLPLSVGYAIPVWESLRVERKMLTAYHYAFATADSEAADEFFDQLSNGEQLLAGDPVYVLRERIVQNNAQPKDRHARVWEVAAWLVKAWTAARAGQDITSRALAFRRSGPRAEQFPVPADVEWILASEETPKQEALV
jgi:hypothetical protein